MALGRALVVQEEPQPRTKYSFSDELDSSSAAVAQTPISNLKPLAAPEVASSSNCGQRAWCDGLGRWVMLHVQSSPLPICTRTPVLIKAKRT